MQYKRFTNNNAIFIRRSRHQYHLQSIYIEPPQYNNLRARKNRFFQVFQIFWKKFFDTGNWLFFPFGGSFVRSFFRAANRIRAFSPYRDPDVNIVPFAVRSKHPDDAIRQLLPPYLLEQHLVRRVAFPRMQIRSAA